MGQRIAAFCLVLATCFAAPSPASAGFGAPGFQSEEISAYTLRAEELKLGPAVMRYGILGQLQVGTWFGLNFIGAINGDLKWTIYRTPIFAIGVEAGVIHFDSSWVGLNSDFEATVIPTKLHLTFVLDEALQVHTKLVYLGGKRPTAQAPDEAIHIARYLGLTGELVTSLAVEWRPNSNFALAIQGSLPVVMYEDHMLLAGEDPTSRGQQVDVSLSLLGAFGPTNFRLGLGYGPSVLGSQGVYPVLDLFWRLY